MASREMAAPSLLHAVLGQPIGKEPDADEELAVFALGCFWGAEKVFWKTAGVTSTAVGYIAGKTPHPDYHAVCSGQTGHAEGVRVVFRPSVIPYSALLKVFWEAHDPTQGDRQGNDIGTQYRSGIYVTTAAQGAQARESLERYQTALRAAGRGAITSEILEAPPFWFAEEYHQQYLHKNPAGYCGLGGCGVPYPQSSAT